MSLPSPLSVGDAFLLATIVYNVGKACSSDAKSAPAEFAEVQSLLFSIGDAIGLVGNMNRMRTGIQRIDIRADVKHSSPRLIHWARPNGDTKSRDCLVDLAA